MRNKVLLSKITYFIVFIILAILILSCNNKQNFNSFFNTLKKDSVIDSLMKVDNLFELREKCSYDFEFDSIRILFTFSFFNCEPLISSVQNVAHDKIFYIEEYNREELESILLGYINLMLGVGICSFQNSNKSHLEILFRLDDIDESTLPQYEIKETNKYDEDKVGVLIYDYNEKFIHLNQFNYYKPVEVAHKWYYYEVFLNFDCDCL